MSARYVKMTFAPDLLTHHELDRLMLKVLSPRQERIIRLVYQ